MKPFSAEITPRRPAVLGYALAALAFVAVGLWMLLAPGSGLLVRLGGLVTVGFFGLAAGLFVVDLVRPRSVLVLDRAGIHLRERGDDGFDAPWSGVRAVRAPSGERSGPVQIEVADPALDGQDPSDPAENVTYVVPAMIGVSAADVAAEIERYRRVFARPEAWPDARVDTPGLL